MAALRRARRYCLSPHFEEMLFGGTLGMNQVTGGDVAMTRTWTVDDVTMGSTETAIGSAPILAGWWGDADDEGDAAIARQAELSLRDLLQVADCGLRVAEGVIHVTGRARRRSEAEALLGLLKRLPGVRGIRGQIECDTDDTGHQEFPLQDVDRR
jgi:hypothetical protein